MAIQTINTGQAPNDGTGAKLRDAFTTANQNFAELDQRVTAAVPTSSLQTGALDEAAGAVLRLAVSGQGAFGLGSNTAPLWPGGDLGATTLPGTGFYSFTSATSNRPPGETSGSILWVRTGSAAGYLVLQTGSGPRVYVRQFSNAWGEWRQVDPQTFGLGAIAPQNWPPLDFNATANLPPSGIYRFDSTVANFPVVTGNNGAILWLRFNSTDGWMMVTGAVNSNPLLIRRYSGGNTWQDWQRIDARAFGLGFFGTQASPTVSDLNDTTVPAGFYLFSSGVLNAPSWSGTAGTVEIIHRSNGYRKQVLTNCVNGRMGWRVLSNGTWGQWNEVLYEANGLQYVGDISGNGVDLNAYQTRGVWRIPASSIASSGVNFPIASSGWLEVVSPVAQNSSTTPVAVAQRYTSSNSNRLFTRQLSSGVWSSWVELLQADSIQASQVDKTAGRLMTVGAFGLGGFTPLHSVLGYANDFNIIDGETGFIAINGNFTNGPRGAAAAAYAGQLMMIRRTGTSGISTVQLYWGLRTSGDGGMWMREGSGNAGAVVWQSWLRVADANVLSAYTRWQNLSTPIDLNSLVDPTVMTALTTAAWTGAGAANFPPASARSATLRVDAIGSTNIIQTLTCRVNRHRPIVFRRQMPGLEADTWSNWQLTEPLSDATLLPTGDCGQVYVEGIGWMRWSTANNRYCRVPTFTNMAVITASATWTPDAYTETIEVEAIGGGGAGGGGYNFGGGGGGGAGQYLAPKQFSVTPGVALTATIGAGGANTSNAGGNTALGGLFPALTGGTGGLNATNDFGGGGGIPGGSHGVSGSVNVVTGGGGTGAGTRFGPGGRGGARSGAVGTSGYSGDSPPSTSYGAGGGGGGGYNGANSSSGGAGAPGVIIVRW
ncbi:pyocin knob domain-containing protein [Bordetella hinzii]|uniref:pyocin knob domain-containing protein n=1 Tax=Bordetella hinzii TaxID=103855 RepID=UPI0039FD80AC